jgi:hypothetical protein
MRNSTAIRRNEAQTSDIFGAKEQEPEITLARDQSTYRNRDRRLTEWLNNGMPFRCILLEQNVKLLCSTNAFQVTLPPIQDDIYEMHQLSIQMILQGRVTC